MSAGCFSPIEVLNYFLENNLSLSCQGLLSSMEQSTEISLLSYSSLLFWTLILEVPFYVILIGKKLKSWPRGLLGWVLANLLTHPFVTFIVPLAFAKAQGTLAASLLLSEILAPTVEMIFIRRWWKTSWSKAALISFSANLFSWWIGALMSDSWFL